MPRLPKGKKKKWIASSNKATGFTKKHQSENSDFYNSRAWRKLRQMFIAENPLCVWCEEEGLTKEAAIVDHIIEIKDGGDLLDPSNLRSMCLPHHNQKTNWERAKRNRGISSAG
tara:strand:- start:595 stop:936 length:342 start_codon:yes stop_codon:yes gene_type:complete